MDKPVAAIERMRDWVQNTWWKGVSPVDDGIAILSYLDAIPAGAVPVVWPAELTRERLLDLAHGPAAEPHQRDRALRALAAIAPERKRRVVNLWEKETGFGCNPEMKWQPVGCEGPGQGWKLVARNVELED